MISRLFPQFRQHGLDAKCLSVPDEIDHNRFAKTLPSHRFPQTQQIRDGKAIHSGDHVANPQPCGFRCTCRRDFSHATPSPPPSTYTPSRGAAASATAAHVAIDMTTTLTAECNKIGATSVFRHS